MDAKEIREKITPYILEIYGKKVKTVWQIAESNAYVVEGNNGNVICHAAIEEDGQIVIIP